MPLAKAVIFFASDEMSAKRESVRLTIRLGRITTCHLW
jgi:hypothetical protein